MESYALGPPAPGFSQAMYLFHPIYYGADSGFSYPLPFSVLCFPPSTAGSLSVRHVFVRATGSSRYPWPYREHRAVDRPIPPAFPYPRRPAFD